jgi:hypothetical protein
VPAELINTRGTVRLISQEAERAMLVGSRRGVSVWAERRLYGARLSMRTAGPFCAITLVFTGREEVVWDAQSDGPRLNGRNGRIWQAYLMGHASSASPTTSASGSSV